MKMMILMKNAYSLGSYHYCKCNSGYEDDGSNEECQQCPAKTYTYNQECKDCHYSCATCNGSYSSSCVTCNSSAHRYYYSLGSSNYCKCNSGYEDDSSNEECQQCPTKAYTYNQECRNCHYSCATCNGSYSSSCVTCNSSELLPWQCQLLQMQFRI
eukprot:TRINITY_DN1308_c0_g1_i16.p1 TRINITY_DN1308_c0_g1~~TRINITY_DN1308_c0_g1_i16.p1  ORF type:complete len:156 (-),score=17.38 TRINITY_DN1308_c0_g1_i16:38-505(-)